MNKPSSLLTLALAIATVACAVLAESCGSPSPGTDAGDAGRDVQTPLDTGAGEDAAMESGLDAAAEAETDAGTDDAAVFDAGLDGGAPEEAGGGDDGSAGVDAGDFDAGDFDAGDFDAGDFDADAGPIFADAGCGATYEAHDAQPGVHIDPDAGQELVWDTNPPSSGEHYPIWAHWGVHSEVLPRGYYVHNEEHGGVVVVYRCDGDCSALRAQLINFVNTLDAEPACVGMPYPRRIVLTEDPLVDTPVAAAAWGYTYHADCFDDASLRAFVLARTGHAPEDFCADGYYP